MRVSTVVSDLKNGTYEVLFWLPFEGAYTFSAYLGQSCYTHIDLDLEYPDGGDFPIGQPVVFQASRSLVLETKEEVKEEIVESDSGETVTLTTTIRKRKELPALPSTPRLPLNNPNNKNNVGQEDSKVVNHTLPYDRSVFPRCTGQRGLREALGWWEDGVFYHALCDIPLLTREQIGERLRNKRILFVGDSTIRFSFMSLMSLRGDSMVLTTGPQMLHGYYAMDMLHQNAHTSTMLVDASINFTGKFYII